MSVGQPRDRFRLRTMLIPEEDAQQDLQQLVTPTFTPEQREQFGPEFSEQNIARISERFQRAQAPRFQKQQARLANLLSATGSLQGTPQAISQAELVGTQQAEVSQLEAGLFERGLGEEARDRRAAETRNFQQGVLNLQRRFNVEDRDLNIQLRRLDAQFELVKGGQIRGTQAETVLKEAGIANPQDFLSDDQIALEREAIVQGVTVPQLLEARNQIGLLLLADMQQNPDRYAGLAIDPEEELDRQLQLAQAQAPQPPKVLCTELNRQGLLPDDIYKADSEYAEFISWEARVGYQFWAIPIVRVMKKSKILTHTLKPLILSWAYHMAYKMGLSSKRNRIGEFLEAFGIPVCTVIGRLVMSRRKARRAV